MFLFQGIGSSESVFRCSRHTESAWHSYVGGRIDEGSAYDCLAGSKGGQCVALLKCKCGLPYTGAWQADHKVIIVLIHETRHEKTCICGYRPNRHKPCCMATEDG